MRTTTIPLHPRFAVAAAALCLVAAAAPAQHRELAAPSPSDTWTFATPGEAASTLYTACETDDRSLLVALFGEERLREIESADPDENSLQRRRFAQACDVHFGLARNDDGSLSLLIGEQEWPFPIPLVLEGDRWRFDAEAGAEELLNRRIGRNELDVLASLRAWLAAQAEYATADRDGDGVREYAQRLASSEGRHDGLYWPVPESSDEPLSPLGPLVLSADPDYVASRAPGKPWHGYRMKVLTRQGRHAPGGAHRYVLNGNMIAGCALLAWPAEYGRSGVMSFLVSHHGTIYEQDLGPHTESLARRVRSFDPGPAWAEIAE